MLDQYIREFVLIEVLYIGYYCFNRSFQTKIKSTKIDQEKVLGFMPSKQIFNGTSAFSAFKGHKGSVVKALLRRRLVVLKLSFKEFWGVQFEKGSFLFPLQRVFGQWWNSWGPPLLPCLIGKLTAWLEKRFLNEILKDFGNR